LAASAALEQASQAPVLLAPGLPEPEEWLPAEAPVEQLPVREPEPVVVAVLLLVQAPGPVRALVRALVQEWVPVRAAEPRSQPSAARTWAPRPCART